jgi:organic radical activating enzyme
MHGKNPVRKRERNKLGDLQVAEIFHTIQGEGPYSGRDAIFIRLTGCNLQCDFCDTKWNDDIDPYMSPTRIMGVVNSLGVTGRKPIIIITGGEPLRQDLSTLIEALILAGYSIQIESNGSFWQDWLHLPQVELVVSPKTPSINAKVAKYALHWKYPLRYNQLAEDGLPTQVARPPTERKIYVTPCEEYIDGSNVTNEVETAKNQTAVVKSAQRFGYIAQLQIHKYFGIR